MTNERFELLIGQLLFVGIIISIVLMMVGGVAYLWEHGSEVMQYQTFQGEPTTFTTIRGIWHDAINLAPRGLIQLGLLFFVVAQVLRIVLTTGFFIKLRDWKFILISLFILAVTSYSFFWRF
ncbi:MAG: DUF1634 domain-containing protein [Proteobacteria bacterium]|nr:DUF1634 domain-containing protein [Pseudomonadota bacterium]